MKERPILFSAPMVRALLAGTKTQTRRVLRDQRPFNLGDFRHGGHFSRRPVFDKVAQKIIGHRMAAVHCPYGQPGDRLWVRETWAPHFMYEGVKPVDILIDARSCLFYAADGGITGGCGASQRANRWRPAIHMPRAASRITLEVTDVRVERLQDISEADALAEGIVSRRIGTGDARTGCRDAFGLACDNNAWAGSAVQAYQALWESINGPGSWDANPWVWAISFKRI